MMTIMVSIAVMVIVVIVTKPVVVIVVTTVLHRLIQTSKIIVGIIALTILISRIMVVLGVKILLWALKLAIIRRVLLIINRSSNSNTHNELVLIL